MRTKKNIFFPLFSLAILLLMSCGKPITVGDDPAQSFCIPDSLMSVITLDTVKSESIRSELKLSGKITFNEDHVVKIFPPVSGHVADVKVSLGDHVEKGQLLAILRSSDMANYFNDFKTAQSELGIAKKNLEVTGEMRNSGISSEKDYLSAQSDYDKALARFNKVNEVMKIYGSSMQPNDSVGSGYRVIAPISGFVVEKNINAGMELRADDGNNLFTISDLKEVWAVANVYETDIARIKTGSDVEVSTLSYPDKKFTGKVERISNILNPETNVMSVKISLNNADYLLKPGMFANISVLFPEDKKMLTVQSNSLLFDDNKSYVVVFRKRCDVEMDEVNVVKSLNGVSYILDDSLQVGDLVIQRNGLFVFTALKKL